MAKKVVAIVGSYHKGGTVDTAVDAVLGGARERGAETNKIYLIDRHIEYCRNCLVCTQPKGEVRGACIIEDDVPAILHEIVSADALVLGSPVNFYNVTAVFRTFLERLAGSVYWPWGQWSPKPRFEGTTAQGSANRFDGRSGVFITAGDRCSQGTARDGPVPWRTSCGQTLDRISGAERTAPALGERIETSPQSRPESVVLRP